MLNILQLQLTKCNPQQGLVTLVACVKRARSRSSGHFAADIREWVLMVSKTPLQRLFRTSQGYKSNINDYCCLQLLGRKITYDI